MSTSARFTFRDYAMFPLYYLMVLVLLGIVSIVIPGLFRDIFQTLTGILAVFFAGWQIARARLTRGAGEAPLSARLAFSAASSLVLMLFLAAALWALLSGQAGTDFDMGALLIGAPIMFVLMTAAGVAGLTFGGRGDAKTA